jgi:hypothetical protein
MPFYFTTMTIFGRNLLFSAIRGLLRKARNLRPANTFRKAAQHLHPFFANALGVIAKEDDHFNLHPAGYQSSYYGLEFGLLVGREVGEGGFHL